ncbi:hypothetical protein B0H10DRAFT_1996020 [Mycena sp. CBHHK59/15]|nr:hypothetical protein B0H10DRAFT_1996020 [Mycena sp. CBHHK59/15]
MTQSTSTGPLYGIPIAARTESLTWKRKLSATASAIVFAVACLMINGTQLIFLLPLCLLPFNWARTLYRDGIRYTKRAFGCLLILMCQWFAPTKLVISFEREGKGSFSAEEIELIVVKDENGDIISLDLPTKFILIANHQVYADWWYAWCLTYFIGPGVHGSVFITLKKSLQWLPILGWAMRLYNFIFLARSWVSDRVQLSSHLSALGKAAEQEDHPLDDMTNALLPRSTGLHYSLRSLAPRIPDLKLIDITTVYPGIPPMGYGQSYYTLRSIFLHGVPPPAIHMHLRMFDVATNVPIGDLSKTNPAVIPRSKSPVEVDIPETEKAVFDLWLRELWREKDESITRWFDAASFAKAKWEIPLKLRRRRDIFDAFCFFFPAAVGYMWAGIRK